ncbi:hypothetical protein ACFLZP_03045 [Patescibacteria group bacterium]
MVWGDKGWGVSVGSALKSWAKPILTVGDQVLIAGGEYGKGRVVWSGLNLIGHMHNYDYNQSEKDFFEKIFNWLGPSTNQNLSSMVIANRDFPDRIDFKFSQATEKETVFYFRESFFPAWKAKIAQNEKLKVKSLRIYRAGPGFKLMFLPKLEAGDSLVLEFKPGLRQKLLISVSVLTFLGLGAWIIFGKKLYQPLLTRLADRVKRTKTKAKKSWNKREEEDY